MIESYEPHVMNILDQVLQPGDICIDAGAHIGEFTSVMAKVTDLIHAFEILPANIDVLRHKFSTNPFITINHMAVADRSGMLDLFCGQSSFEGNIIGRDMRGNNALRKIGSVEAISIDQYVFNFPRLNLVKMDVEGAEHLVLKGMVHCLRTMRPLVIIEFHDDTGWAGRKYLQENDYRLWAIYHNGQVINDWVDYNHDRIYHCMGVPSERANTIGIIS